MDDGTLPLPPQQRNQEDYDGAVCLLVRVIGKRRNAKYEALIDAARLADVSPFDWVLWRRSKTSRVKYVVCLSPMPGMNGWVLPLHRFLNDPPQELVVDHKNRRPSDNRGQNLRACTPQQNAWNTTPSKKGGSMFKGVSRRPGRITKSFRRVWKASITVDGQPLLIGWFCFEEQAAYAYNVIAQRHRGEFAYLNEVILSKDAIAVVHDEIARVERDRQSRKALVAMPPLPPRSPVKWPISAMDLMEIGEDSSR